MEDGPRFCTLGEKDAATRRFLHFAYILDARAGRILQQQLRRGRAPRKRPNWHGGIEYVSQASIRRTCLLIFIAHCPCRISNFLPSALSRANPTNRILHQQLHLSRRPRQIICSRFRTCTVCTVAGARLGRCMFRCTVVSCPCIHPLSSLPRLYTYGVVDDGYDG